MEKQVFFIYMAISIVILITDIWVGLKAFKNKKSNAKTLGVVCFSSAVVTLFYMLSIISTERVMFSVMSSIYFCFIDIMLMYLMAFVIKTTRVKFTGKTSFLLGMMYSIGLIDMVFLMINIFTDFVVSYEVSNGLIMNYVYAMHWPYVGHLIFDYALLVISVGLLIMHMVKIPVEYRRPYVIFLMSLVLVVAINALWLFIPAGNVASELDYSVWGYSIAEFVLYWACFSYSVKVMPNQFRVAIVETLHQGIVMFDIEDQIILTNDKARKLLPESCLKDDMPLSEFTRMCGFDLENLEQYSEYSMQIMIPDGDGMKSMRCDYKLVNNAKHQKLGCIFVLSDELDGVDILTGFHSIRSFEKISNERVELFSGDVSIIMVDIIGLKLINASQGRNAGDEMIMMLAKLMREIFPKNTFFVRGQDANLAAICKDVSEQDIKGYIKNVQEMYSGKIQYAIGTMSNDEDLEETIIKTEKALRARKLMDKGSHHSEILNSLLVALEECDPDTEKHVERTQELGAELGRRIGLGDAELSNLSLLCILHDIGKIGIPMEILNKPGKLTDEEWVIMRSHVEKGYQITNSNQEFSDIAPMVRAHHERWDGKGYPDKLEGENIPILSRIISIVDAYDAMVNDRIYRPAMNPYKALDELRRCAGTQFDPNLVEVFIEMLHESDFKEKLDEMAEISAAKEENRRRFAEMSKNLVSGEEKPSAVEVMSCAKLILKIDGRILFGNEEFTAMFGYEKPDWENNELYLSHLIAEDDFVAYAKNVSAKIRREGFAYYKFTVKCKDDKRKLATCIGRTYYDSTIRAERGEVILLDAVEV